MGKNIFLKHSFAEFSSLTSNFCCLLFSSSKK